MKIMQYFFNILIMIDQSLNTIIGGDPDETLSSRFGKCNKWACRFICRLLDKIDYRHCKKSIEKDEGASEVWKWNS